MGFISNKRVKQEKKRFNGCFELRELKIWINSVRNFNLKL